MAKEKDKTPYEVAVDNARQAAHDRIRKPVEGDSPAKKAELEELHKLVDLAPVIYPAQNPPAGYPRVEVALPQPDRAIHGR